MRKKPMREKNRLCEISHGHFLCHARQTKGITHGGLSERGTTWSRTLAGKVACKQETHSCTLLCPSRRIMCAAYITGMLEQKPDKMLTGQLLSSLNINSCFLFCNKNSFFKDKKLKELQRVKLEKAVTHFWRWANSNLFLNDKISKIVSCLCKPLRNSLLSGTAII